MLTLLSGVLGFLTSGLPSFLNFFQQRGDQAHEREMAKLQTERELALAEKGFVAQQKIEEIKLDEINSQTYAQERVALYDSYSKESDGASQWVINLRSSVRPVVTYIMVFLILFTDIASLIWAINTVGFSKEAVDAAFSSDEMGITATIIGFWFGSRHWGK